MRKRNRKIRLNNRLGSRRNRILVSIALVAISLASWLVTSNTEAIETKYFVAVGDLTRNTKLNQDNLTSVSLNLNEQANLYLPATKNVTGWYLLTPIRSGELIPISAISETKYENCVGVKVNLGTALSPSIHKGSWIDLWAGDSMNSPSQIVTAGELISITNTTDALSQSVQQIEVCVSPTEISGIVSALAKHMTVVGVLTL